MKFKTWEKIYWGIILVLFLLSVVFALLSQGDILVKIGGGEYKPVSKGAYIGYALLGYLIIFVPIWLIARWIVNRNDKDDKERERERERTAIALSRLN